MAAPPTTNEPRSLRGWPRPLTHVLREGRKELNAKTRPMCHIVSAPPIPALTQPNQRYELDPKGQRIAFAKNISVSSAPLSENQNAEVKWRIVSRHLTIKAAFPQGGEKKKHLVQKRIKTTSVIFAPRVNNVTRKNNLLPKSFFFLWKQNSKMKASPLLLDYEGRVHASL